MLGVNSQRTAARKEGGRKGLSRGGSKKGVKVVYISSPMKVKTSAAEFRATVQELTGRDSDVARLMDYCDHRSGGEAAERTRGFYNDGEKAGNGSNQSFSGSSDGGYPHFMSFGSESPPESDSLFEDMGAYHRDLDAFTSSMFQDSALLEVLGSFDSA